MSIDLSGRAALVTGGSRGLGRVIAERLMNAGCDVAILGRSAPERPVAAAGREAFFVACDVRDPDAVMVAVEAAAKHLGGLDILINNAGGSPESDAATASPRFAQAIVGLNLLGPLYVSQAALPWLRLRPGASIVNVASVAGRRPSPGTAVYGAAKAGLISLTRSLAQEWGPQVRVNAIIVGLVETEAAEATYGSLKARAAIADSLPLKRMGCGSDVADAALYLVSPLAAYVSGAELSVDGGGERPLFLDLVKRDGVDGA